MAQQVANGRQIDTRFQKRYGSAVPEAVRMQSLLFEIWRLTPGHAKTSGKDMADSEAA